MIGNIDSMILDPKYDAEHDTQLYSARKGFRNEARQAQARASARSASRFARREARDAKRAARSAQRAAQGEFECIVLSRTRRILSTAVCVYVCMCVYVCVCVCMYVYVCVFELNTSFKYIMVKDLKLVLLFMILIKSLSI